jgi:opacity protein-like surface antigen
MKKQLLLVLFACLLIPTLATAADSKGVYGSFNLSYVDLSDSTFSDGTGSVDVKSDGGYGVMAALGYKFDNSLRAEGEIAYRHNDLDSVAGVPLNGDAKAWSLMANGYYDIQTGSAITPYIGAGLGVARVSQDSNFNVGGVAFTSDGKDTVFAYQAILGVAYPVADKTTLGVEYRYFATENPKDEGVEAEYRTNNIGLRLSHYF